MIGYVQQRNFGFAVAIAILGSLLALYQYYLASEFGRQLLRLDKKNPEAVQRYLHQWWICKNPRTCPRCRGWLGGLAIGTGGWIGAFVVYGFLPTDLIARIGLPATYALGVGLLFLTPIHGMLGRLGKVKKNSLWEMPAVLETIGGLSALSAPLLAAIAYAVWKG